MLFCDNCNMMMYFSVDGDTLVRKCKNCNFSVVGGTNAECIVSSSSEDQNTNYKKYMSKYIKFDPTLPRVNNIKCVNEACTKPASKDNEVIYIKYDHTNMKYLYMCCHCDQFWK